MVQGEAVSEMTNLKKVNFNNSRHSIVPDVNARKISVKLQKTLLYNRQSRVLVELRPKHGTGISSGAVA